MAEVALGVRGKAPTPGRPTLLLWVCEGCEGASCFSRLPDSGAWGGGRFRVQGVGRYPGARVGKLGEPVRREGEWGAGIQ